MRGKLDQEQLADYHRHQARTGDPDPAYGGAVGEQHQPDGNRAPDDGQRRLDQHRVLQGGGLPVNAAPQVAGPRHHAAYRDQSSSPKNSGQESAGLPEQQMIVQRAPPQRNGEQHGDLTGFERIEQRDMGQRRRTIAHKRGCSRPAKQENRHRQGSGYGVGVPEVAKRPDLAHLSATYGPQIAKRRKQPAEHRPGAPGAANMRKLPVQFQRRDSQEEPGAHGMHHSLQRSRQPVLLAAQQEAMHNQGQGPEQRRPASQRMRGTGVKLIAKQNGQHGQIGDCCLSQLPPIGDLRQHPPQPGGDYRKRNKGFHKSLLGQKPIEFGAPGKGPPGGRPGQRRPAQRLGRAAGFPALQQPCGNKGGYADQQGVPEPAMHEGPCIGRGVDAPKEGRVAAHADRTRDQLQHQGKAQGPPLAASHRPPERGDTGHGPDHRSEAPGQHEQRCQVDECKPAQQNERGQSANGGPATFRPVPLAQGRPGRRQQRNAHEARGDKARPTAGERHAAACGLQVAQIKPTRQKLVRASPADQMTLAHGTCARHRRHA